MRDFFEKHKIKIGIICATLVVSVGGFFVLPDDYHVFPKAKNIEIELGSPVDNNIATYIWGMKDAVSKAQLDISNVDNFTAGDYQIYVTIGNRTITYNVNIIDTVAPDLSINPEVKYTGIGREYDAYKFISEVTDLSNTEQVYFKVDETLQDTISFDAVGEYTLTIVAKDVSGNETEESTTVSAEVPPRFMGLADTTIPLDADFDYSKGFVVYDETDGFITEAVTINDENVDFSKEGTYEIIYSVVNSKGVDNDKSIRVTTSPNSTSDYKYATNLTDEDWDILLDNDYFKYELLEELNTDKDKVAELVKPISINISKIYSETRKACGSAFIYKIEEDYIYGLSVEHVLDGINNNIELTFFDDVSIHTNLEYEHLGSNSELAIFRIKTNEVPEDTMLTLKEAYIDASYYDTIPAEAPLLGYVENHGFYPNFKKQLKPVTLVNLNEPNHPDMNFKYPALATTRNVISGMSGGPLIDYQGRILGATSYVVRSYGKDYYMKIDTIDELVEKFNEKYN